MNGMVYFGAWLGLAAIRAMYWVVYGSFYLIFFAVALPFIALYEIGKAAEQS
jgi:hypothetical protein